MAACPYDFDTVVDRSKFWTEKHDLKGAAFGAEADAIPMWVADMDFPVCPEIQDAIRKRAEHPTFGYTFQKEELWLAVRKWFAERHDWIIEPSSFIWSPSVMLSASFCLRAFSEPGDAVMVMTPLYAHLQDMIEGEGRKIVRYSLKKTEAKLGSRHSFSYSVEFDNLENQIVKETVKVLVMCNPHNPGSKVWSREELEKIVGICRRQKVLIISDEIHCDWCLFENQHIPLATLACASEVITLTGPGKTFGIPGLQCSFSVIADEQMRKRYMRAIEHTLAHEGGLFGTIGMLAAYSHGARWLEAVKQYVEGNVLEVEAFVSDRLPEVTAWRPQATFLMWLDFARLGMAADEVRAMLVKGGVCLTAGKDFGEDAQNYQRLNIACSRKVVLEALERIEKAISSRRPNFKRKLADVSV